MKDHQPGNEKLEQLDGFKVSNEEKKMTTNQGLKVNNDQDILTVGERGPSLLEDFIFREKMTHFDHERIPERVVHARGTGAHGVFKVTKSLKNYTKAKFLAEEGKETPVFVRFSTVAGNRGSTDLARDVRGFAVKFYTEEGNYDLVANNIPVFFIQDPMKFPDLAHAVKPEPHNEIPQAQSAHDTFWDFISLMPESMHMIMWIMSDRAIPRSLSMIEGFGVHSFKLVNDEGKVHFVKFHFKPKLGVHSVAWDEAQRISGVDPDFHRRDLWESIDNGLFPEWDFGVQLIPEEDEHKYDFDLLDPTKLVPEELVPVDIVGTLTLNRNTDNFFAETEQIAFHPAHIVPGIDFTNDPLLQGRLFSYTDTQLIRLGGPNFHEIPINRSVNTVHNNQRDGYNRQQIDKGRVSYSPNSIGGGCPFQAMMKEGGFVSQEERVSGTKVRQRSKSFVDHYSQAKMFYNSQSGPEKRHLQNALIFELSKVTITAIRDRVVSQLAFINKELAQIVAESVGAEITKLEFPNQSLPADCDPLELQSEEREPDTRSSEALSMMNTVKDSIKGRKIGFITAAGADAGALNALKTKLEAGNAVVEIIGTSMAPIQLNDGSSLTPKHSLNSIASVAFDALHISAGKDSAQVLLKPFNKHPALNFINEAYKHCKAISFGEGTEPLYMNSNVATKKHTDRAIITAEDHDAADKLIKAIAGHRVWDLELERNAPEMNAGNS